jgi:nucleoside-diphosphate-sugar epimerase
MPRRIAVTGARGFVASRLIPMLLGDGAEVVAILRPGRERSALPAWNVEVRHADLDAASGIAAAFAGCEAVVHLSGMFQGPQIARALDEANVPRAVLVSSAGVHTKLESRSAEAKRVGEAAINAANVAATILRPSMIYGTAADRNLARLIAFVARYGLVPLPGGGRTPQQPIHVDDLSNAIRAALARPSSAGRAYDVGGPVALPLRQMVRIIADMVGKKAAIIPLPIGMTHSAVVMLRRLRLPAPIRPEQILRLAESKAVDISAAVRDLGFTPRTFEDGIRPEVAEVLERHGLTVT